MDYKKIISGVEKVLETVTELTPLVGPLGGGAVAGVATLALAGIHILDNLLMRVGTAKDALNSTDEAKVRAVLADLQAANDKLAGAIKDS